MLGRYDLSLFTDPLPLSGFQYLLSMPLAEKPALQFDRKQCSDEELLGFFRALLKPRMIEEKMLWQLRKGKISKWFSGIGQEAISVGATLAMKPEEFMLPMHRNLGVFTTRGIPLHRLFAQFQGKKGGFTNGRDRSFHFGTQEFGLVGMISHLGPQMGVADGIALASKLSGEKQATLVFTGEGGTSEGDFHEALNVAAVWDLPVIFVIENNGYGLSTPVNEQYRCEKLVDRAKGYGMNGIRIDGNNLLEVYHTIDGIATDIREKPRPWLVECMTFRMRGHEEASGTKYVPEEKFEEWEPKDPVENFERFLRTEKLLDDATLASIREAITNEIEESLKEAYAEPVIEADAERELAHVYAPAPDLPEEWESPTREMRYVDAVSDGLWTSMKRHDDLVLMGQDIAEYGGVFKVTEGFLEEFGRGRVRNTPLCESAILGAALGMSIKGRKSMVEMQFADFVSTGFNQVVNNLAKAHYRWGQNADVVVRMPTGGGVGAAPYHSQSTEGWFVHTPGLKVAYPAFPNDAKGLLMTAFEDPNPVMFFEHKMLYRSIKEEVPEGDHFVPFGKARKVREGEQVSIITYGAGVHWALEVLDSYPDISADLIDLRTLLPYDKEAIAASVRKTSRAIVLQEAPITGGIANDISAFISQECFMSLDAPVIRCGAMDTPVPFAQNLEDDFLPRYRFEEALKELVDF